MDASVAFDLPPTRETSPSRGPSLALFCWSGKHRRPRYAAFLPRVTSRRLGERPRRDHTSACGAAGSRTGHLPGPSSDPRENMPRPCRSGHAVAQNQRPIVAARIRRREHASAGAFTRGCGAHLEDRSPPQPSRSVAPMDARQATGPTVEPDRDSARERMPHGHRGARNAVRAGHWPARFGAPRRTAAAAPATTFRGPRDAGAVLHHVTGCLLKLSATSHRGGPGADCRRSPRRARRIRQVLRA